MKKARLLVGVVVVNFAALTGIGCSSSGSSSTASKATVSVGKNPTSKFCTQIQAFAALKSDTRAQRAARLAAYDRLAAVMPPALKDPYSELRTSFAQSVKSDGGGPPKLSSKQQAAYLTIVAYSTKECGS